MWSNQIFLSSVVAGVLLSVGCFITRVESFIVSSSHRRSLKSFYSGFATKASNDDEAQPIEKMLSSPEEMEEFLNNLAAKLSSEMPDEPAKDRMTLIQSWAGDYDKEAARKRLQKQIDEYDVLIFGFSSCPYTTEAKTILKEQGVKFMAREFDSLPTADGYALRAELASMLERPEVPAIFIKGEFIGGVNDGPGLKSIIADGKLNELLEA